MTYSGLKKRVIFNIIIPHQCNFAVVQYGNIVRTELSLKENDDATKAIKKIPGIEQIKQVTVTASAINHVL